VEVSPANVYGIVSLFVWSLVLVVCLKYLVVVMRADNQGEGGILALLALTGATRAGESRRSAAPIIVLGVAGAALLYGDGVITPAISVLSAVEGLTVATSAFAPYVVPLTVVILVGLFAVQSLGSGRIGAAFGPVLALWFVTIGLFGVAAIAREPRILGALNPVHGFEFFRQHGWHGFPVLGAVVLCLTGGEALYADMGHFGQRPIRLAWFTLAFPTLILCYLGQGATLLRDPAAVDNPFFRAAPAWALYFLVGLATLATVIASQALITAVFSMTRQAMQLGFTPRLLVVHTSSHEIGQVYLPALNWALMLACLALVVGFQSSIKLAAAFGLAVSGTMGITTILFGIVARTRWRWSWWRVGLVAGGFLTIDLAFLGANLLKVMDGGWIPLVIGAFMSLLLLTWYRGRQLITRALLARPPGVTDVTQVLATVDDGSCARVPGTAVYMNRLPGRIPQTLQHNLKHNRVVHERVIFLTVSTELVPHVAAAERLAVEELSHGFWRLVARYGYMEDPHVPELMRRAEELGLPFLPDETTYILGRETIISSPKPGMARWRERLFGVMVANSLPPTAYFDLPPDRVVELGSQVEI
jgi:KUP system potassium uptake protein